MKNPFICYSEEDKTEYLSARCSLNRAVIAKLPLYGVDDEIEGKAFVDVFSTPVIVEEIRRAAKRYGIDLSGMTDADLPKILSQGLESSDARLKQMAQRVTKKFGNRLGLLFLTLKTALPENRAARDDWDDACWTYWQRIETIILTGGLASSMLGRRFKEYIHTVFDMAGVKPYRIMLFDNGRYLGVMGLALRMMEDDTSALVMDLGHTGIKRALVRKRAGEIAGFTPMDSLPTQYMQSRFDSRDEKLRMAIELHRHIVSVTASSYKDLSQSENLSDTILISIANYTHGGKLNAGRGGYAKLCEIDEDYARVLEEELSGELHRRINVKLVHDSTASALYFSDVSNAVCITLGTGFGVGFPAIHI